MPKKTGLLALTALTLVVAAAVFALMPPIAQDPAYHALADTRTLLGVPRFGDVVSNLPFVLVGLAGLAALRRMRADPADLLPLAVFFASFVLIGAGSAWYHWSPTNETLFWDRLPMTVAFMGLLAAILADRLDAPLPVARWMLALLVALGIGSVIWWHLGEMRGAGDLRAYGLVQFYPALLVPLVLWLFPKAAPAIPGRVILGAFLLYGLSKVAEALDHQIFALLGGTVSGHSVKHLLAAAAPLPLVAMLRRFGPAADPGN